MPPRYRSMNQELHEGATDASLKRERLNVEEDEFDTTAESRASLFNGYGGYNIYDASDKILDYNAGVVKGS